MNNNKQEEINFLDIITMVAFIAQLQNMEIDGINTKWIHNVIFSLAKEVQKLHEENDVIINKIDKVLKILENGGGRNAINR